MPRVRYAPAHDGRFTAPTLRPGQVIEVSHDEATHLLATQAFELVETTAQAPTPEITKEPTTAEVDGSTNKPKAGRNTARGRA